MHTKSSKEPMIILIQSKTLLLSFFPMAAAVASCFQLVSYSNIATKISGNSQEKEAFFFFFFPISV